MSKHTQGPWKSPAYNPWNIIAPKESNGGCDLYHVASVKTSSNGIANARLIAAAPELLEALENISSLTEEKRIALIAKATGA